MSTPSPRTADAAIDPVYLNRWSPRSFDDTPMTETELKAILEAARWAPSAMNAQPWRFAYTLRGDSAWAAIHGGLVPGNQLWAGKAAALVVIASYTKLTPPTGGDPFPTPATPLTPAQHGHCWHSMRPSKAGSRTPWVALMPPPSPPQSTYLLTPLFMPLSRSANKAQRTCCRKLCKHARSHLPDTRCQRWPSTVASDFCLTPTRIAHDIF